LHAYQSLAVGQAFRDVNHSALRLKISFVPPHCTTLDRNPDFEVRTNGHIEARAKRGSAAA
jgi:hypothetical protein